MLFECPKYSHQRVTMEISLQRAKIQFLPSSNTVTDNPNRRKGMYFIQLPFKSQDSSYVKKNNNSKGQASHDNNETNEFILPTKLQ